MNTARRSLIRATGVILFGVSSTGCLFGQSRGIADVEVYNKTLETKIVEIIITDRSGENSGSVQFREKFTVSANGAKDFNNKVVYNTDDRVEVHIKNGLSDSWQWDNVSNTLDIIIKNEGIVYREEG